MAGMKNNEESMFTMLRKGIMHIGIVGLGKMGQALATRLINHNISVSGYDPDVNSRHMLETLGGSAYEDLGTLASHVNIVWIMVPAGQPVDDTIAQLITTLPSQAIIIDGGNSHYRDSQRRATYLEAQGFNFMDCGTSGGIHGKDNGFSLMIGGKDEIYQKLIPLFSALAAPQGFGLFGPAGAGHYVKMIHNGVEYALLQAYAEGFHLLHEGAYPAIDLEKVCQVWHNGSVVRSWIVHLARNVFAQDQELTAIHGSIGENKTGQWTQEEAQRLNIPTPTIDQSLAVRAWSRECGGNYATKVIALLRNQFGGHAVTKTPEKGKTHE